MRHPSRRNKQRHKPPRRGGLVVVNEAKGKTRYYRGPGGRTIVVWHDGRFVIVPGEPTYVRTLAGMPKGLARRVREAQSKGKNSG